MKKISYIILSIILSITIINSYAQNLVPNPSFETYSSCPTSFSQTNRATPWYDPTAGSSDYYNACATGFANVPFCANGNGYQFARTGSGFTGLYALNGYVDGGREYIQVQLISPLVHDSCYFIEFYCNLANGSWYSIKRLGAYLSDTAIHYTGPGAISVLHYTPQIVSNTFLSDTLNWMRIDGYYQATGGEKFLTIGDFKSFSPGDTLVNPGGAGSSVGYGSAYYLIDDVSITKVAGCDTVGVGINEYKNNNSFKLYPNPNNGTIQLEYSVKPTDKVSIKTYDVTGKLVEENVLNPNTNRSQLITDLKNGIYFYQIIANDHIIKSDKLVIIK